MRRTRIWMKAAIHAMHKIYKEEHNEAVLLADTANAFNFVNRKVFLHNINVVLSFNKHLCTELLYITIPFIYHWRGRDKIFWKNIARQGDPVGMPIYALSVIPLMLMVLEIVKTKTNSDAKMIAYADDFSAAGSISSLKYWWIHCEN